MIVPANAPADRPLRIFVGTHEIGRQAYDLVEGFRRLGHHADGIMYYLNPQHGDLGYTRWHSPTEILETIQWIQCDARGALAARPEMSRLIQDYFNGYDVYVFQFASSLLPGNADFSALKKRGKRIISLFNGSDTRHWSSAEPVWEHYGLKVPEMYREMPFRDVNGRLLNMRMAERYADAIFSLPSHSELALRPYNHFYIAVDVALYRHNIPARDVPIIVHAPSRRATKGTDCFLTALDTLRDEGHAFELRLLEGRSNQEVIDILEDADIVLDQLDSSTYGMLALEAMATGCAVCSGNEPNFIPLPIDRPAAHVDSENVLSVIRRLIVDKTYRVTLAEKGHPFVKRHHAVESVAQRLLDGLDIDSIPDYHPTFFAERYELPETDVLSPAIKKLTSEIVDRYGLPKGVYADDLIDRRLMSPLPESAQPVLNWQPWDTAIRREFWGWSPLHSDKVKSDADAVGQIVQWVMQALKAIDAADHDAADRLMQQCIDYAAEYPESFSHSGTLVAIGHLARALGDAEVAEQMFHAAELAERPAAA